MTEVTLKTSIFWLLILALCFVALPVRRRQDGDVQSLFDEYLTQHEKKYDSDEYTKRLEYFKVREPCIRTCETLAWNFEFVTHLLPNERQLYDPSLR